MASHQKVYSATALISMCCIFFSGCGRHHGEVSFQTDGVTQTVRQGQIALRAGFPLPIYPQAQPSGSVSATSNQGHEDDRYLMLFSNDDLNQVKNFYRNALKDAGWKLKNAQESPDMVNITAQKENLEAGVMLTRNQNKTTISLSVSRADSGPSGPIPSSRLSSNSTKPNTSSKLNLPDD